MSPNETPVRAAWAFSCRSLADELQRRARHIEVVRVRVQGP